MNKKSIVLLLLIPGVILAKTVGIGQILATVQKDDNVKNQENTISQLKSSSKYIPYLDEFEFRVNTLDPFSKSVNWPQRQKYAIRLSPNGFGETYAARKVLKGTLQYSVHKKDKIINSLLKDRYTLVIDMLYNNSVLQRMLEEKDLLEDRISVLEKMVNSEEFDFSEIVKAETDYSKLQLDIIEQKNIVQNYEIQINGILPYTDSVQIDTAGMVEVAALKRELQVSVIRLDSNNIYLEDCLLKLRSAEDLFRFENATNRKVLSFLEFEFDAQKFAKEKKDKDPDYNQALSFGLAITVPIVSSDKIDINRRLLSRNDAQEDYYNEKKELEDAARVLRSEINALIGQYEFLTERRTQIKTESFLGKYMHVEGENPLVLLKIKQSIINNEELMDEIKYKIYDKYVKMLDITGKLSEQPLRNLLSKNREEIQ